MIRSNIITLEVINGQRPLDHNQDLYDVLFGQTPSTASSTYVFLEAARYFGLVEMLESQQATFCCLFSGAAAKELRDVAPYLVKVAQDDKLIKNLLSGTNDDDPPWMMWPSSGAVFLRSGLKLPDLRSHFRHFTRLYDDESEKWNYFRFFAPEVMLNTVANMDDDVFGVFSKDIDMFVVPDGKDRAVCLTQTNAVEVEPC